MKTHTHTPGPWKTTRSHSGLVISKETQRDFETKETRMLAFMVRNEDLFPVGESDANARLIAAAPDLLQALEDAAFLMRMAAKTAGPMQDSFRRSAEDAAKALAKAEGRA